VPQQLWNVSRILAVIGAASTALGGCEREAESPRNPRPVAAEPPVITPAPPLPPPPVSRAELLIALDEARSAFATGQADPEQNLAGRRFSIRQAFGCTGTPAAQMEEGVASWAWGSTPKTIVLSIAPADLTHSLVTPDEAGRWEAAEGYWLTRPWMRADNCPAVRETVPTGRLEAVPAPTPRWTDGLAAVFDREGSRVGRREGKAFTLTLRNEDARRLPPDGYRLVIEGRFAAYASGRAVKCQSSGPNDRPVCIAAALVDRVAIEKADGKLLQEWRLT
jgi:hypothetical protein